MKKISDEIWQKSFAALEVVASDIRGGCSSASLTIHLGLVAELERHAWHRSVEHHQAAELKSIIETLGKELKNTMARSHLQLMRHNSTTPVNVDELRSDLEEARQCVTGAIPWFLVFAKDAGLCGAPCSVPFEQISHDLAKQFGVEPASLTYLEKLTRVGLSAKEACDCSNIRALASEGETQAGTARELSCPSEEFTKKNSAVVARKKESLEFLLNECSRLADCSAVEKRVQFAFSQEVHDIFRKQLGKLTSALNGDLYGDASAILTSMHGWEALHQMVQPDLKIIEVIQQMKVGFVGETWLVASLNAGRCAGLRVTEFHLSARCSCFFGIGDCSQFWQILLSQVTMRPLLLDIIECCKAAMWELGS